MLPNQDSAILINAKKSIVITPKGIQVLVGNGSLSCRNVTAAILDF